MSLRDGTDDPDNNHSIIQSLIESDSVPYENGEPIFNTPWQARAFGLAVALNRDSGMYEWSEFQERLVQAIANQEGTTSVETPPHDVEDIYYERWLTALERLLIEQGHITPEEIDQRTTAFESGDRTAAEFVEGEHEH